MIINIAVAITKNGGIGQNGGLPWPHLKGDMALFSKRTTGAGNNAVLMGKNTWCSIPENRRPLKNRTNIIISSSLSLPLPLQLTTSSSCCHIFSSINDAIAFCEAAKYDELWIIGGSRIYNDFLNTYCDKINRVYITCVCSNHDCDTFIDIPADSYLVEEKIYNAAENCYYLTCVHKMRVNMIESLETNGTMETLSSFLSIIGSSDNN